MTDLTLYTKTDCPYCAAAKEHLNKEGRAFTEFNITDSPDKKADLLKASGGRSEVPVIVDGDNVTVGFGGS